MAYLGKVFLSIDSFSFLGINIILAWSLYILMLTGQSSIGHAAFFATGAYLAGLSTATWGLPFSIAVVIGTIGGGVVGFLFGLPCLRMRGMWLVMATVGLCEIVNVVLKNTDYVGGPNGFMVSFQAPMPTIWMVVVLCAVFTWLTARSRFALACRSVAQDSISAEHLGIDLTPIKLNAFIISGAMAALAGGLYAHYIAYLFPDAFSIHLSLCILMWVILGGQQSFWGPVAGVVVFTYFSEFFEFAEKYRELPFFFLVLVIVLWRPQGLIDKVVMVTVTRWLRTVWLRTFKLKLFLQKVRLP
jgi:branched-chain amino acid transport system permease protein